MTKVKGWKCFDQDLSCRGFKFEIGKTYQHDGPVVLCHSGFHFHEQPHEIFNYYNSSSRVCEIEAEGVVTEGDKSTSKAITIGREVVGLGKMLLVRGNGDGYGNGDGDGYGNGDGDGYGNGDGYGDGYGNGDGYGYGNGNGDGYGLASNNYLFSYIKEAI